MASRDMGSKEESFVMLVCVVVSLTGSKYSIGFWVWDHAVPAAAKTEEPGLWHIWIIG